jgi:hypothetical protein
MSVQDLVRASELYTICVCFLILFAGVFGHLANILIFTSSKLFRKSQSAFYLTTESIVNCINLLLSFTSRIAINGFNNDLTQRSVAWCKLRQVFATSFTFLSLTITCFATIDQYLSTSYNPYIKQLSTLKLAQRLTAIAIIICTLHGIPFLVLMKIESTQGCASYNTELVNYVTYFYFLILTGLLPIVITSIFAILAYNNVRRIVQSRILIVRRRLDQQLTAMILVRVVFLVSVTLPYVTYRIYLIQGYPSLTDPTGKAIVTLVGAICFSLFYLNYSVCDIWSLFLILSCLFQGSFYLFLIASGRFRRQVKYVLIKKYWRMYCKKTVHINRVAPVSHISSVELD